MVWIFRYFSLSFYIIVRPLITVLCVIVVMLQRWIGRGGDSKGKEGDGKMGWKVGGGGLLSQLIWWTGAPAHAFLQWRRPKPPSVTVSGRHGCRRFISKCDRLRNDRYCVGWGVKLYSLISKCGAGQREWSLGRHRWRKRWRPGSVSHGVARPKAGLTRGELNDNAQPVPSWGQQGRPEAPTATQNESRKSLGGG